MGGDWFGVNLDDCDPGDVVADDWSVPPHTADDQVFFFAEAGRREPVDHWSDLLFQSTWWQDAEQNIHRLDELDERYCRRIHGFAARLEDETGTRLAWEATRGPEPSGAVASDSYNREMDRFLEMVSRTGWIHETDLMVALQRRMQGWPAVDGTCFCGYPMAPGWDHSACRAGMEIA